MVEIDFYSFAQKRFNRRTPLRDENWNWILNYAVGQAIIILIILVYKYWCNRIATLCTVRTTNARVHWEWHETIVALHFDVQPCHCDANEPTQLPSIYVWNVRWPFGSGVTACTIAHKYSLIVHPFDSCTYEILTNFNEQKLSRLHLPLLTVVKMVVHYFNGRLVRRTPCTTQICIIVSLTILHCAVSVEFSYSISLIQLANAE